LGRLVHPKDGIGPGGVEQGDDPLHARINLVTHNALDSLFQLGRLCWLFRFLDHDFTPWRGVLDCCWYVVVTQIIAVG
jgi:hypothetical protein